MTKEKDIKSLERQAEAIQNELAMLEKRVEAAGWPTKRGEPVLRGTLQEIRGVGHVYHPRGGPNTESELIDPDHLDLDQRHHVVYRLRTLRAELARSRQAADRARRRRSREAQADARREAASEAAARREAVRRTAGRG